MVSINYATREVSCKIVYYGPGLSGKTTNLQYIHLKVPSDTKGKLISLATDADRTLYFDFLPINIGTINGFAAKFQLYTVPGQVYYNATRKLVLRGTDGVVFVADSQPDKMDENIESLNNLKENLAEYGYSFDDTPFVIQYNKQDLPGVLSMDEMKNALNSGNWPQFGASATEGTGVFDTLKCILKMVLDKAKGSGDAPRTQPAAGQAAPQPAAVSAPPVQAPQPLPVQPIPPQPAPPVQTVPVPQPQPQAIPATQPAQPQAIPAIQPAQPMQPMQPAAVVQQPAPSDSQPIQPQYPQPNQTPQPEQYQREQVQAPPALQPVQQAPPALQPVQQAYRPFPGNTAAEEQRMSDLSQVRTGGAPITNTGTENINTPQTDSDGMPQMAPSLKADKTEKPKKRSFFKRLFGLK
ncbi:MAG: GTPase [candidate division Zixibacteria bacterium]|nr:GTPase [candidate division Zixibacteria bacterium]